MIFYLSILIILFVSQTTKWPLLIRRREVLLPQTWFSTAWCGFSSEKSRILGQTQYPFLTIRAAGIGLLLKVTVALFRRAVNPQLMFGHKKQRKVCHILRCSAVAALKVFEYFQQSHRPLSRAVCWHSSACAMLFFEALEAWLIRKSG